MRLDVERYSKRAPDWSDTVCERALSVAVFCRRKAMKGRLYFATKAKKEGKNLIKMHPCAQIFCCDFCGFEKVRFMVVIQCATTRWHCNLKVAVCSGTLSFYLISH